MLLVDDVVSDHSLRVSLLKRAEEVARSVPANTMCETTFAAALSATLPEVTFAEPTKWGVPSDEDNLYCRSRLAVLRRAVDAELPDVRAMAQDACVSLQFGERAHAADMLLWLERAAENVREPLVCRFLDQAFRYLEASLTASPDYRISRTLRLRRARGRYG